MAETFNVALRYRLDESEFTTLLESDNNPYGSLLEPNDINFNFSLRVVVTEWVIHPFQQLVGRFCPPVREDYLVSMSRQQFYRFDEARKTMEDRLRGLVGNLGHQNLAEYACDQALKLLESNNIATADNEAVLNLHFDVRLLIERRISLEEQSSRMVPAADSSMEMLKRATTADYIGQNMRCSICLEDFPGDKEGGSDDSCSSEEEEALLSMPCSHVFHGDCIKKWLSVSHYCPLCRLELPTSTN